jgi:hypothetical protein
MDASSKDKNPLRINAEEGTWIIMINCGLRIEQGK